jgi:hypothetical protein
MSELASPKPKKLLDQPRDAIRNKHYSYSAEKTYVHWAKRYILFHNKRHPNKMGGSEIELFLTYLAATKKVCPSTQNQALSVLLFLYREVLDLPLDLTFQSVQARRSHHLSTVLSKTEVERVMSQMSEEILLMSQLLYGCGLRLMECLRLQIHVPELYYSSTDLNISSPTFRFSGGAAVRIVRCNRLLCDKHSTLQLGQSELHHLDDQRLGDGFVQWELDGTLGEFVIRKLIGKCVYGVRMGIESNMLGISSDHDLLVALASLDQCERWYIVVHQFGNPGCCLPDV